MVAFSVMKSPRLVLSLALLCVAGPAHGQVGEKGRISTRSDVRMSIEGMPGTSSQKIEALAKALSAPLTQVKSCYAELVKEHPKVVGELAVGLLLPEGKKHAQVSMPSAPGVLTPMKRCVDRAFGKLSAPEVPRPAEAKVLLELTNSAADAVDEVKQRGETAAKIDVQQTGDAGFASRGASLDGKVAFQVRADNRDSVERVHRSLQDALPGLFDCRRRAAKRESPEGDVALSVQLKPTARANVGVESSSVANERAPRCVDGAVTRAVGKGGRGKALVTVHFAP